MPPVGGSGLEIPAILRFPLTGTGDEASDKQDVLVDV